MNRWLLRQAGKLLRVLDRLDAWLAARRGRSALDRLVGELDALEGRWTILVNGYPPEPGQILAPDDELRIFGLAHERELEVVRRSLKEIGADPPQQF